MTTELAIRADQSGFDDKQLAALKSLGVNGASNADIALFFHQAARTGLDPFARQIYMINRGGKQVIQTGIDGFRLIRDRAGTYQGHDEEWCGQDGQWRDVWLSDQPPAAARVSVYVKGYQRPVVGIALWTEYAQLGRDGKPQALWNPKGGKPALMLAKCAEALALRKAYPQDLSGLYTSDEIPDAEQDADGVYVTTTMRDTRPISTTTPTAHNGSKRASRRNAGVTASGPNATPDSGQGPGRSRPQEAAAGPTIPDTVTADEWTERIHAETRLGRPGLYALHDDADHAGVLTLRNRLGRDIESVFVTRRTELQAPKAMKAQPPSDEDYEAIF